MLPVSYFLLADPAGLFFSNDTFNLLVEDSLLLHLRTEHMLGEKSQLITINLSRAETNLMTILIIN